MRKGRPKPFYPGMRVLSLTRRSMPNKYAIRQKAKKDQIARNDHPLKTAKRQSAPSLIPNPLTISGIDINVTMKPRNIAVRMNREKAAISGVSRIAAINPSFLPATNPKIPKRNPVWMADQSTTAEYKARSSRASAKSI